MPYAICWACVFIKSCRAQAPYRPAGVMIHRPNGFPNPRSFLLFGGSTPVYICAMVQNENSRWRCQFGRQFLKSRTRRVRLNGWKVVWNGARKSCTCMERQLSPRFLLESESGLFICRRTVSFNHALHWFLGFTPRNDAQCCASVTKPLRQ